MHEFRTILTANMMYIKLQNYTNMVVGEHGIQTFKLWLLLLLLLLLSFDVFVPTMHIPYEFWTKGFVQIYLNAVIH